ncbi:M48 family metalloprotease [Psychrobacter sp. P11G5]|uniref:M48 family metalloprotease n=1 Tax=Psychrobacter sp. P11G5 TaxID=1699624 RepID=UPI00078E3A22|nr:M48 family metalloprotease [Psychrobacter sp. P11G5]AMN67360.1 peptidase M48 [Psychrobacter sp. P11G5]
MDFFGEQRTRTQRSLLLYGLFFLIVFAHIAVALGVMTLLLTLFTGGVYYWALVLVIVWTLASFIGGSFLEYRRLKAGGRAIAQRVGAVRLFIDNSQNTWEHSSGVAHQHETVAKVRFSDRHIAVRDERDFPPVYRRYYETAQQLAIASGLSMPILYVLPDEQGINGFVAGRHSQDMVLVVTQGALDKLSDDGLYGLIGHEYGHILHGDATFNLQLMVVLAGLQIVYDWSDPISNNASSYSRQGSYFDSSINSSFNSAVNRDMPLPQSAIDSRARSTEAQTESFTTHSDWVSYWQTQSNSHQSSAKSQSRWLQNRPVIDRQAPRSVWTLLLHGLSFSSMASAQLIKHSFNRQRELLADATSVQLTRSPAIMETLKAIHQDSLGSRLSNIADINGLSHFFFASSGADLGEVSWFATHPSLAERMSAINANAYHDFAIQVAREKRLNQQKIKKIYEQRRLGDWGAIKENSLSSNKKEVTHQSHIPTPQPASVDNSIINSPNDIADNEASAFSTDEPSSKLETDVGLEFVVEEDVVVDGRLQVHAKDIGTYQLLKPWQAETDSDLPSATLISIDDIKKVSLPQYVLNHSYHPLGAQALIEAVMLCHQGQTLSMTGLHDLKDIWIGLSNDSVSAADTDANTKNFSNPQILAHTLDHKLLKIVASLDRRLDSALITFAVKQISQHNLSESTIDQLRLKSERSHSNQAHQHYVKQQKCRTMLLRYQQGLLELFGKQLSADLTKSFAHNVSAKKDLMVNEQPVPTHVKSTLISTPAQQASPILSLWQALHLQQLRPIFSEVLNDTDVDTQSEWQPLLQRGMSDICAQLDPSGQVFNGLNVVKRAILTLLAYRLSKDVKGQMILTLDSSVPISEFGYNNDSVAHYIVDLHRHTRLIDIDLTTVSDANLQWLLLTAQNLNSIQLLAIIDAVPIFQTTTSRAPIADTQSKNNYREGQQDSHQIDYNEYRQWLSTLHTVMLHDTIISQDEYDCLMVLAEHWLGVRQIF